MVNTDSPARAGGARGRAAARVRGGDPLERATRLLLPALAFAAGPTAVVAQADGETEALLRADSIRASLELPPARPAADALDVLAFPFKIVLFPVGLAAQTAGALFGVATRPDPSVPARTIFAARRWGLDSGLGSIGPRSGLALVIGLNRYRPLFVETGISLRKSQRHRVGVAVGDTSALGFVAAYQWRRDAADHFWGLGPRSAEERRSDFLRDKQELGARAFVPLAPVLRVLAGVAVEDNRVDRGRDGLRPDVQDTFAGDSLFGIDGRPRFVRLDVSGIVDLTHWNDFQRHGVRLSGGVSIFRGVDGTESDFHRFQGELHAYVPVNPAQSLAFRALLESNHLDGGLGIPFFDLSRLGGSRNGPRGFSDGRFRDRAGLSLMAEWRYEVWEDVGGRNRAEGFLFLDSGGVAPSIGSLGLGALRESYGLGLRLVSRDAGLLGLAYLGFSTEGVVANFRTGWTF